MMSESKPTKSRAANERRATSAAVAKVGAACNIGGLESDASRVDILNRLKRAEGQIRGIQRMIEQGEDCLKIGQQFSAVSKALESTYLRMTLCFVEQGIDSMTGPDNQQKVDKVQLLKEMEDMLARMC